MIQFRFRVNIAVPGPANLAFTIRDGTVPLGAYVITEPTRGGFQPGGKLVVKDLEDHADQHGGAGVVSPGEAALHCA